MNLRATRPSFAPQNRHRLKILATFGSWYMIMASHPSTLFFLSPGLQILMMYSANAIRDYQYLRTMPTMSYLRAEERRQELDLYFPEIARLPGVPYRSRYCSLKTGKIAAQDPLRDFLIRDLPRKLVWTKEERNRRVDEYLSARNYFTICRQAGSCPACILCRNSSGGADAHHGAQPFREQKPYHYNGLSDPVRNCLIPRCSNYK